MKKSKSASHTSKHSATKKHSGTSKHAAHEAHLHHEHVEHEAHLAHIRVKAKPATHAKAAKARSLSPGTVGCCAAEALAASLRLAGASVTGADVLALHRRAGADDETGAPVAVLLEAAAEFGLAGYRPVRVADLGEVACAGLAVPDHRSLILGVDLPGPHAVLATPDGWWSWGELWCPCEFPDAVIEEAWAIGWVVAQ